MTKCSDDDATLVRVSSSGTRTTITPLFVVLALILANQLESATSSSFSASSSSSSSPSLSSSAFAVRKRSISFWNGIRGGGGDGTAPFAADGDGDDGTGGIGDTRYTGDAMVNNKNTGRTGSSSSSSSGLQDIGMTSRGGSTTTSTTKTATSTTTTTDDVRISSSIMTSAAASSSPSLINKKIDVGTDEILYVTKRDGRMEVLDSQKLSDRLTNLSKNLSPTHLQSHLPTLLTQILSFTYPNITTVELDTLASETAASKSTQHPDYARLAARICITANHKITPSTFTESVVELYDDGKGFVHPDLLDLVRRRGKEVDDRINGGRDWDYTYFGVKTLERSYLLKTEGGRVVERPQYMLMRVALGIHCVGNDVEEDDNNKRIRRRVPLGKEEEDTCLEAAFETYEMMSRGMFTHASPTLFHSGTVHPQLSSCFLVQMSDDSINGIYDTLKRCALISKSAGGIGLSVHNIRARGTYISGTRGISNGLVPLLRVYDVTSRYVDQGGGKRPGAFAIYLEPWHADIFDVLNLKKNHGKEEQRARDLFYGLWVCDLFMKRVMEDGVWSLMCPKQCGGLSDVYGDEFTRLYEKYEEEGRFVRQVRARELWGAILDAQTETGTPYLLYKDACNEKSNQKNLGTIQCSNLCTEIIQYTDEEEVAVCNLASICLTKFVVSTRGPYGSTDPSTSTSYFDHAALHTITKIVTRNLNKIIDVNQYPIPGAKTSNLRHRPIGIGVSGLADAFLRLGLPFTSDTAKELNEAIFETIYHAALEASAELAEEEGMYETFGGSPASKGELQYHMWGLEDGDTPSHRILGSPSMIDDSTDGADTTTITAAAPTPNGKRLNRYSPTIMDRKTGYDWAKLRTKIIDVGLRNSLLVAPMPTASTSQILGVNECFEPFVSNLYLRRVKAGEFIMANPHLMQDLTDRGLWNPTVRNQLMRDGGSVANIDSIPPHLKELYKTVWEIKMKDIIDMAADRGRFIDQSQSLNLFVADPTADKLTAMHFYAWKKGLKTGMYYLRTKPAVSAIQYTVDKHEDNDDDNNATSLVHNLPIQDDEAAACPSCTA